MSNSRIRTRRKKARRLWACATAASLCTQLGWAQSPAVESAAPPAETQLTPRATQAVGPDYVVALALRHSPTLSVASIEHQRTKYDVLGEEGRYQLVFQADAGYTRTTTPRLQQPTPGSLDAVSANSQTSTVAGAQLTRNFALGTTAVLRIQGERFENSFGFVNPLVSQANGFGTTARLTLTQPLMRGAGTELGLVELHAAEANRSYRARAEERVASQLVRDVLTAYWELWYASQAVEIQRQSMALTHKQKDDADARVKTGALAPADALTFETRLAELEEALVEAEANERSRALELRRLTGAADSSAGAASWSAAAAPEESATPRRAELERAMKEDSVELAELAAQVQVAEVRARVAGDELRPRLDLDGYVESRGVGVEPASALERAGTFAFVSGHVGLTFELPTDSSRKDAEQKSALLAVSSAKANLRAARDRIASEAAQGVTATEAAEKRLSLSQRTLEIAQRARAAAQGRFDLGLAIPIQVQEADEDLRQARLREARARVDLATEQAKLQHLSGLLLARYVAPS